MHFVSFEQQNGSLMKQVKMTFIFSKSLDMQFPKNIIPNDSHAFRTIIEASPLPVYLCMGEDLLVTIANAATLKAWGKTSEVLGKPFHEILPELTNQPFRQLLLEVYHKGTGRSFTDYPADMFLDGALQTFYFSFSYQPFKDDSGKVTGVFCIASDVTEKVLAKQRLAVSEQKAREAMDARYQASKKGAILSSIVATSFDAIISKNLAGMVESWNDAAERMFGYSADEMIGQSIYKIIPPEKYEEEKSILFRLEKGERVENFKCTRLTKDHKLLDISVTISPIMDEQEKIIGISKIARDITEQMKVERHKNDFITIAGNELNTPLTTIKSYTQLLLLKASKEYDTFKIKALGKIEKQADKMTILIQNLLDNAKLVDGHLEMEMERFDLNSLLTEMSKNAESLFNTHKVKMIDCESLFVMADRNKIGQVLHNLISNAVKYSAVGSEIIMRCVNDGKNARISITDDGIGISKKDQARVFDRFFRIQNEEVKNISGFGIGLFLAAEIMRLHEGKIYIESKENEGSIFYFDLPIIG